MSRTKRNHKWSRYWYIGLSDKDINKDRKPRTKPPGWFKRMYRKLRRARQKQALRENKDLPRERKTDTWNWN